MLKILAQAVKHHHHAVVHSYHTDKTLGLLTTAPMCMFFAPVRKTDDLVGGHLDRGWPVLGWVPPTMM